MPCRVSVATKGKIKCCSVVYYAATYIATQHLHAAPHLMHKHEHDLKLCKVISLLSCLDFEAPTANTETEEGEREVSTFAPKMSILDLQIIINCACACVMFIGRNQGITRAFRTGI